METICNGFDFYILLYVNNALKQKAVRLSMAYYGHVFDYIKSYYNLLLSKISNDFYFYMLLSQTFQQKCVFLCTTLHFPSFFTDNLLVCIYRTGRGCWQTRTYVLFFFCSTCRTASNIFLRCWRRDNVVFLVYIILGALISCKQKDYLLTYMYIFIFIRCITWI
jgi:hypothetical protein